MSNYWQKLQDPRWQKLRLEAMQKSDFCCEMCGNSESMLQVHHKEYFKGHEPWEYDIEQLAVLCKECHENHHSSKDLYKIIGSYLPVDGPKSRDSVAFMILGFIGYSYQESLNIYKSEDFKYLKKLHEAGCIARNFMSENKND